MEFFLCDLEELTLLMIILSRTNSEEIVLEMLSYLETADYSIREEMVSYLLDNFLRFRTHKNTEKKKRGYSTKG
jgi:hypothetical protein